MTRLSAIIVEDEVGAANHLSILLSNLQEEIQLLACFKSVQETVEWIVDGGQPDLAFLDIQLEDGLSFEIFKRCDVSFPVIFTTAFDQYAIDAFKVNSIDYLLKPIKESQLKSSVNKYKTLRSPSIDGKVLRNILEAMGSGRREYTLLIHHRGSIRPITETEFAYFHLENGQLYGCTKNNQSYSISCNIEQLFDTLDQYLFFRANRQVIVNRSAIAEAELYFNGRLSLKLRPPKKDQILISKARVSVFKEWLSGSRSSW